MTVDHNQTNSILEKFEYLSVPQRARTTNKLTHLINEAQKIQIYGNAICALLLEQLPPTPPRLISDSCSKLWLSVCLLI